jgi:DNA-binding transcriptional regulator LsrR (DeoR family)
MAKRRERGPSATSGDDLEQLRLVVKVAHMYNERGLKQPAIATQLKISQARVSRLLKQAAEQGIVRTTVHVPPGIFTDLEDAIEQAYGLDQVVVVDTGRASDEEVTTALGPSTASFLESAVPGNEIVGISSWSETLLAGVERMRPAPKSGTRLVVQVLGGFGPAGSQAYVTRLTESLARACHARPVFLLGPGVVGTPGARQTLLRDPHFAEVVAFYDRLSMVLVGIGSLSRPSRLLRESSAVISAETQEELRALGAVGDLCLRFFDEDGRSVSSSLDARVLGISVEQLKRTPRTVAVAGGARKFTAIRGALRGGWVDTLITDLGVAERLVREP